MGRNSKIEWTNHTFNPWWGCVKVSQACKHCYAETWARRVGQSVWGPGSARRFFGDKHWAEPLSWNAEAAQTGVRLRVFCASMGDVFEDRPDLDEPRRRLWTLIEATPALDWLLLTKRPENAGAMVRWNDGWPPNAWLGTTVEDQASADLRLPVLAASPAPIRFISAEPLLGPLDLEAWLARSVNWVITGGESGPKARPSSPSWFRVLMRQCAAAKVPFHFKQWGDWAPGQDLPAIAGRAQMRALDGTLMVRLGKKAAGRQLDGSTWDGLPRAA